jgi:hypothetical protein
VRLVDTYAHEREASGERELLEGCVHWFYRRRAARKGEPKKTHRRPIY